MKRTLGALLILGLAACASSGDASIVAKPHPWIAKAGILPSKELPEERDGVPKDATGAIMFICSNSDKHEDKEVLLSRCPSCGESNYFYLDHHTSYYVCFACTKTLDPALIKCPDCGKQPRLLRTRAISK